MPLKITAIITMRNEHRYMPHCFDYYIEQGIEVVVIDNDSSGLSASILKDYSDRNLITTYNYPYSGFYDWYGILNFIDDLRKDIITDWIIRIDSDELLDSPKVHESLSEAINRVDKEGYNVINFNEYVFVPLSVEDELYLNHISQSRYFYFFEPSKNRLMRAYKNEIQVSSSSTGGHRFPIEEIKLFPNNFILKHYISLSQKHFFEKYHNRDFSKDELLKGWHKNRVNIPRDNSIFPRIHNLNFYDDKESLKMAKAKKKHFWEW